MKKKILLWSGLALLLALIIGGIYFYRKSAELVIHPKVGPISESVYGLGKVKSHHYYEAISGIVSTLERNFVEEGQEVKAGDPLFKGMVVFRTPIAGTVTLMRYKEGENIPPNTPIARVEDLQNCYIELSLEQESALRVRKGMNARVSFESIRNRIHEGKVIAIFPRQDEFLAQVEVGKLDQGVLPGMTADVVIEIGNTRKAVLVPAKAVVNGEITLRKKKKWVREKVDIGFVDGTQVEILAPALTPSDELRMKKEH